jgi:hypothetical protein
LKNIESPVTQNKELEVWVINATFNNVLCSGQLDLLSTITCSVNMERVIVV